MIISRTPFRISFMGGGTDMPDFYREEEGCVLSTTVNKYMYITVNDRFDSSFRLSYSKTEIKESVAQIEHPIFKAALTKWAPKGRGLEVISMADIPAGSGLGSSSSFTVGLVHALRAHLGIFQSSSELAEAACKIEIDELGEPIGKQDQFSAAFGGFQFIRFYPNGSVSVDPVICPEATKRELESSLVLFFTGRTRSASEILKEQKSNVPQNREALREMKKMAEKIKSVIESSGSLKLVGEILKEGWQIKKTMAAGISTPEIDQWYDRGMKAGAWGGKILGAGGGGFLFFLCHPDKQAKLKSELSDLRSIPFEMEKSGSQIIFVG